MNKKIVLLIAFVFCLKMDFFAQNNLQLNFLQMFDNELIKTSKYYFSSQKDSLKINDIKCYISAIELEDERGVIYKEENSYHLLDLENPSSFAISFKNIPFQKVRFIHFNVGIDSLTSVSGALSGDLDPANGMYWAWQSGYINFKIEGESPSCRTRKKEFQFHVGGYMQPFYAMRKVDLKMESVDNEQINIKMNWAKFFHEIPLSQLNSMMIPSNTSMQLADWVSEIFSVE